MSVAPTKADISFVLFFYFCAFVLSLTWGHHGFIVAIIKIMKFIYVALIQTNSLLQVGWN